jgi:putative hydrolase of the HAD superfamily
MRGIIFDLDDTLYRRADFVRSGFDAIARYVSHSWRCDGDAAYATLIAAHADGRKGREFQALCQEHRLPQSLVSTLTKVFRRHQPALELDAGVGQMLEIFRRDGWRLAVLTNGAPDVQRRKVAALGLEPLVDAVIYAEEHALGGKPHPAAFHAALERLGVPASRCLCIGDDPVCDIAGARSRGLRTIRMMVPGASPTLSVEADAVAASIAELPAHARALVTETPHAA